MVEVFIEIKNDINKFIKMLIGIFEWRDRNMGFFYSSFEFFENLKLYNTKKFSRLGI